MPDEGSITVRHYIQWRDENPIEPSSTLVLSSPSSYFIDLRILLPSSDSGIAAVKPPDSTIKAVSNCAFIVESSSLNRLEWGFAGNSSRSGDELPARGTWNHWVDSKTRNADVKSIIDEGELFAHPIARYNPLSLPGEATEAMRTAGAEMLELEKGNMPHPRTCENTDYEELWGMYKAFPALEDGEQAICVVLKTTTEEEERDTRGMVIRVGQWCQGILRQGEDVIAERWVIGNGLGWIRWDERKWRRIAILGNEALDLPCNMACDATSCTLGQIFDHGKARKYKWKVEEVASW